MTIVNQIKKKNHLVFRFTNLKHQSKSKGTNISKSEENSGVSSSGSGNGSGNGSGSGSSKSSSKSSGSGSGSGSGKSSHSDIGMRKDATGSAKVEVKVGAKVGVKAGAKTDAKGKGGISIGDSAKGKVSSKKGKAKESKSSSSASSYEKEKKDSKKDASDSNSSEDEIDAKNDSNKRNKHHTASNTKDIMTQLINLQKADGSWAFNSQVLGLLNLSDDIKDKNICDDNNVWITAITLKYLEVHCSDSKNMWTMAVKKTIIFLKKHCKDLKIDYEDLMNAASSTI